jgi:hypothetical protein
VEPGTALGQSEALRYLVVGQALAYECEDLPFSWSEDVRMRGPSASHNGSICESLANYTGGTKVQRQRANAIGKPAASA